MKKIILSATGLLLAGGLFIGCASAPTQQLEQALAALDSARAAQVDLYVADLYQAAQDSLDAAQAEIEFQNSEFALSRDFDRAERLLQYATETAQSAMSEVDVRKEEIRTETDAVMVQAQDALNQVQTLMAQAPVGKEGRIALVSISEDSGSAQTMLNEAAAALANDNVIEAHRLAQASLDKANMLIQELQTAISKTTPSNS